MRQRVAIIGAGRIAEALERHGDDYAAAFQDYHKGLCGFVDEVQRRAANEGMATIFPADEAQLAERDRRLGEGALEL